MREKIVKVFFGVLVGTMGGVRKGGKEVSWIASRGRQRSRCAELAMTTLYLFFNWL
jgi:hypothetical protein